MLLSRLKEGITGFSLTSTPLPQGEGQGVRVLMTAREALYLGTRGGAAVLGRDDLGSLQVGKCADFFAVNLNRLEFTGMHDPVAAVVFAQSVNVDYTVVGGKFIVKEGQLVNVERGKLIERHNAAAKRLFQRSNV